MNHAITSKDKVHRMLKQSEIINQVIAERLTDVNNINSTIKNDVGKAVRCLQFEDMVNQLLQHVSRRVEQVSSATNDFSTAVNGFTSPGDKQNSEYYYEKAKEAVGRMNQALSRAVAQSSVDEGGIDLF
jgi:methyl-accepting chemotaxis protein